MNPHLPNARSNHRMRTTPRWAAFAVAAGLLAACGDDDDSASTTVAASTTDTAPTESVADSITTESTTGDTLAASGLDEFCAIAVEVNASEPTVEVVRRYVTAAPDEIAAPAAVVLAAFEEADGDLQQVFGNPDVLAAVEELTAFEAEACGIGAPADPDTTEIDPDAIRVDVVATEYHLDFEAPSAVGRYSFVMTNSGVEPHLMVLVHLEDGVALEDVMSSEGEEGVIASFESDVAPPGAEAVVTADLVPGTWVLVCPIPNADGESHAALGMVHEFTIS